jgi:histone H3/H4
MNTIMSNVMDSINKPSIVRLARRAGVKSLNGLSYDEIRGHMLYMVDSWISNIVNYTTYNKKKTIDVNAVASGIPHKYFSNPVSDSSCKPPKKYKENIANNEIEYYQNLSGCLMIPKLVFARNVKFIIKNYTEELRISGDAMILIQHCLENCVVHILSRAQINAHHAKRSVVKPSDIDLYKNNTQGGNCRNGSLSAGAPLYNFGLFLSRLQKLISPDMKLDKISKSQINQFINLLGSAICEKAKFLNEKKKKATISPNTILYASRILLSGELAKTAEETATNAVSKYLSSKDYVGPRMGRQERAGLILPVARVSKFFKKYKTRVGSASAVYLTGVLEHIAAEIFNICSDKARGHGKNMINSRILKLTIGEDEELYELSKTLCFDVADGGVIPRANFDDQMGDDYSSSDM